MTKQTTTTSLEEEEITQGAKKGLGSRAEEKTNLATVLNQDVIKMIAVSVIAIRN